MKARKHSRFVTQARIILGTTVVCGSAVLYAADNFDVERELPTRYGYLVVDTIIGRSTTNWRLNNSIKLDDLPLGRQTKLMRLPEGEYQWQEIDLPYFDLPHRIDLTEDRRWSFTIKKQQINYAGTLIVDETRGTDSAGVRFVNRTSDVVVRLNEQFPDLTNVYEISFSGIYRDDYLSLINNETSNTSFE